MRTVVEPNKTPIVRRLAEDDPIQIGEMVDVAVRLAGGLINAWNAGRIETARIETEREQLRYEHAQILEGMKLIKEERTGLFKRYFERLDEAIDHGDTELATSLLTNIRDLAAKAPFAALQDLRVIKQNLADPEHEWEL